VAIELTVDMTENERERGMAQYNHEKVNLSPVIGREDP
jgi:hypothetical protein